MPLVPTGGTLVSLDAVSGLVGVVGDEATVWAGTQLGALGPALAGHGRAMANLPDINKQSLGGALGTATHGTGKNLPAMRGCRPSTAAHVVRSQCMLIIRTTTNSCFTWWNLFCAGMTGGRIGAS